MRTLFAQRNFRLLFLGLVTSTAGDWLLLLVFGIWVKTLTGSNAAAGLTIFFVTVPVLAAPVYGVVVDRFRRRPFLIALNLLSAALLLPLALLPDAVWLIYATAAAYGITGVMLSAALNGVLKELLPEDQLASANGVLQTVKQGLRLIGPVTGAGLFAAFGGQVVALIDAATFVVAAAAIALLRLEEDKPVPESRGWLAQVGEGVRFLAGETALRRAVSTFAACLFALGMIEVIAYAVTESLDRPPEFLGVLVSTMGAGAIVGGLCAASIVRRLGELGTIGLAIIATGLGCFGFAIPSLPVVLADCVLVGFAMPIMLVADMTLLQRRTPAELIGRVSGAAEALVTFPQTLSIAMGAGLVALVDFRLLLVCIGVALLGAGGYAWTGRRLSAPAGPAPGPRDSSTRDDKAPTVRRV
jgi:Major Facilitator Superfamily